jgi:hypothetical protein
VKNLPTNHLTRVSGPGAALHPCVRNRTTIGRALGYSGAISVVAGGVLLIAYMKNASVDLEEGTVAIAWMVMTTILWPIIAYMALLWAAIDNETSAMQEFYGIAHDRTSRFLKPRDPVTAVRLGRMLENADFRYSDPRRLMLIRIAEAARVYDEAVIRFGGADRKPAETIYADTLKRIVDEAGAEFETITAGIANEDARNARDALEDLSFALADTTRMRPGTDRASLIRGSGGPRVAHLAATAEKALILNPDLTDSAGGRIDALVREHMPRMLATYADLSMAPGGGSDADRAYLNQGIDMIGKSVDEGLAMLRNAKAEALRIEIAFLTMRRGETALSSIPDRSAAA